MKTIIQKIESLKSELSRLEQAYNNNLTKITEEREKWHYTSFKETCKQTISLLFNQPYKSYDDDRIRVSQSQYWNKEQERNVYENVCNIYNKEYGDSVGFITTKDLIYTAVERHIKKMWVKRIQDPFKKEERSLAEFAEALKDTDFLIKVCEDFFEHKFITYTLGDYELYIMIPHDNI